MLLSACHSEKQEETTTTPQPQPLVVLPADTVPPLRDRISAKPAATYSEPISDELNDWKFAVQLYETKKTFQYIVRVQAKEVRVSDSLTFPNLGSVPVPAIQKGKEPYTCIIGFLDNKGDFKEYKKVSFSNDQLRIKTIRTYYVGYTRPQ